MTFVYVFVLTEIHQHMAVNMTFVYVFPSQRSVNIWR